MGKLVLVESPSKCGIIASYLGPGYKVVATYGHFRAIGSLKHIDISPTNVNIQFTVDPGKGKQKVLRNIQKDISETEEVILATDDDREGEAIAWHICDHFSLPIETTKRIVFHEITQEGIQEAISNPKVINMNIVHAQFARQVLDILIGYKISPMLWKYVSKGDKNSLSAGRCQTPALRLIHNNHDQIVQSGPDTPETLPQHITGYFTQLMIPYKLNCTMLVSDINEFLETSIRYPHVYTADPPTTRLVSAPSPFNTSRLIQASYTTLNMSPKETMRACQVLYERGLITYMRTDNNKYSKQFVDSVAKYVTTISDSPSIRSDYDRLVERSRSAHEAIRPTNIFVVDPKLTSDKHLYRLYKLIWSNSLMSCLEPAVMEVLPTKISAPNGKWYEYNAERPIRLGWTKFQTSKSVSSDVSTYSYLLRLAQSTLIQYKQITTTVCLDKAVTRYSESSLVRILETEGIGRPSTFASIIEKLQTRQYAANQGIPGKDIDVLEYQLVDTVITPIRSAKRVGVEKNKLVIQPTGMVVSQFLYTHFEAIFNIGYTRQTELELDAIVRGEADWVSVCFQNNALIVDLLKSVKTSNVSKFGIPVDESNTFIIAKYGPVVKHVDPNGDVSFLPVNPNVSVEDIQSGACTLEDILKPPNSGNTLVDPSRSRVFGVYEGKEIIVKKGRYGRYIVWGDTTKSIRCFGSRDILNITMDEMGRVLTDPPKRRKKASV